jgi:hypothetical protein
MLARTRIALAAAALGTATAGAFAAVPAHAACDTSLGAGCTSAGTQTTTVSAALDSSLGGARTIAAVPTVTLGLNSGSITSPLAVTVVETLAAGANPWGVTLQSGNLTSGGNTLTADNLKVADGSASPVTGGCLSLATPCTETGGGTAAKPLNTAQKLFAVAGESTGQLYTGTYIYSGNLSLSVPNAQPTGVYTGTLTFTLLQ